MAKTLADRHLGRRSDPQDVRMMRNDVFDMMETHGYPVIHKHRWTEMDLREGRARRCPLDDELYHRGGQWDPVCFGTGFVGGFADGVIVYCTIADTPMDVIRPDQTGILTMEQHPQFKAPWIPEMGDGDLIILADFGRNWEVIDMHERYELREVNPTTMRGPGRSSRSSIGSRYRVGQSAQMDKLPFNHAYYNVPVVFDYSKVPDVTPNSETLEVLAKVRGAEQNVSASQSWVAKVAVITLPSVAMSVGARITGKSGGTSFTL